VYGKIYTSMFTGSMCGSGSIVFVVFTYAIVNARPDCGSIVSLNPLALCGIIGEEPEDIEQAIRELCEPDPNSRTPTEDGRRLIRIGESMDYKVVNLEKYRFLDSEDQRTYWREKKREHRRKKELQAVDNKGASRTVKDIPGNVSKCPHTKAEAKADTKQNTHTKSVSVGLEETKKLIGLVSKLMRRKPDAHWSYEDQAKVAEIARRSECFKEFEEIQEFYNKMPEKRYFPASVTSLLEKWDATLDRARRPKQLSAQESSDIKRMVPSIPRHLYEHQD